MYVLDAMRAELVEQLSWSLQEADETVQQYDAWRRRRQRQAEQEEGGNASSPTPDFDDENMDPYLDADVEILKAFEQETNMEGPSSVEIIENDVDSESGNFSSSATEEEEEQAVLVISNNGTVRTDGNPNQSQQQQQSLSAISAAPDPAYEDPEEESRIRMLSSTTIISSEEADDAQRTIRVVRDYLPQIVSVVLRSPPAFDPNLIDPVDKLRQIILRRCVEDANWGVDMCWLLEAEVGRAWKTLFEHRQQTGRRLIVVLPAEKAAVLAKIGSEKREAFDLLQDAEQATAFGYTIPLDEDLFYHGPGYEQYQHHHHHPGYRSENDPARLPSSLSLRRCSHFGDTMHFIDRLTKISLDLRHVPNIHRHSHLNDSLREMNRRVRRRMVTRGDVSLDVEDHRGPDDWPQIVDMTVDMLRYSVHLPVDPKQNKRWPGGAPTSDVTSGGAVRVLNIVTDECRVLASRERCPFLIHLEVAETGLRGSDSRLYASGAPDIGTTIEEALSLSAQAASAAASSDACQGATKGYGNYHIPNELFTNPMSHEGVTHDSTLVDTPSQPTTPASQLDMPRGGSQADEAFYYQNPDEMFASNAYDNVREDEYQQLHDQMHSEYGMIAQPLPPSDQRGAHVTTGEVLLDRIFGTPWVEKCEEIRQASPYGKVEGWRLASFIIKAGEDIRREALVMQIITKLNDWFTTEIPEDMRPCMRPYTIMCVGGDAGVVECLSDAKSVDELKKSTDQFMSLRDFFDRAYGSPTAYANQQGPNFANGQSVTTLDQARQNFLRSLVGYSVVCYILQIKDRHNANILMDREGHIIHIDFGYVLGDTPKMAKVPLFSERAPFKLSPEFWDVLGGWKGLGVQFCQMFQRALECAAAHAEEIEALVEASMLTLTKSPQQARFLASGVKKRLRMRGGPRSPAQQQYIIEMVNAALNSFGTTTYDWLQRSMNGYE
ncbi:MAG: hypothetical protein SGILL_005855 [Bacillariaceae sp.]